MQQPYLPSILQTQRCSLYAWKQRPNPFPTARRSSGDVSVSQAHLPEHGEILLISHDLLKRDGPVVVVEVMALATPIAAVGHREAVDTQGRRDACQGEEGVEHRRAGGHALTAVGTEGGSLGRTQPPVGRRHPDEQRHVELVIGRYGRGMEELLTAVVEDVLAMVGGVEQGRGSPGGIELTDETAEEAVGGTDAVVVGVQQLLTVGGPCLTGRIGPEHNIGGPIALTVVEMGTVHVEHDQLLRTLPAEYVADRGEHLIVVHIDTSGPLPDEHPVVGLPAEDVDERMVVTLVGDERGVEAGLPERCDDTLLTIDDIVVLGRSRRQEHRHALVGGVGLGDSIAEHDEAAGAGEQGRRVAVVAVKAEAAGARRLADDQHINLAHGTGMGRPGMEGEARRCLRIVRRGMGAVDGQDDVVEHIDGIEMETGTVAGAGGVAACQEDSSHGERHERTAALPPQERTVEDGTAPERHDRLDDDRQIDHHHEDDGRQEIAEQLGGLPHIGRHQIEKHIDGDDRMAEEIEQHELEGRQDHQRKEQQGGPAGTTPQRQQQPDDRTRQDDISDISQQAHALGEAQRHIGQEEYGKRKPEDAARRGAAMYDISCLTHGINTVSLSL